ncbi:2-oxoacid:ferredoxin oxidoreductase subunit beta [Tepidibacter aestuarii]|uniref:2-oxoacid:ferredoxin oxidoreductase subunit beta n=1 Tax=Tepidibacter aestuarii TaxID=2925782 RepID=UPI0020BE89A6|nr:2-oxoacid:ferredoxin oxidoreductase subunit beta [Tepidibacter aestuarii]CAH2212585.1 2-oxoglutarate/2-oxoacid ferredoxin oxidoreductase subunit beta [Tepidibacter aestuarii]
MSNNLSSVKKFDSVETAWCPGCGNHGILTALKQALWELNLEPHEVLITSGIGQAAKTPQYINVNGFNGLHGRSLPPALGAKIANKNLKVIVNSGDGDTFGEGGNHVLHNMRRNIDIAHFVHDNQIYGLTKGQASPTTAAGQKTSTQTNGVINQPLNPIAFAIISGATFVARTFAGDKDHLVPILKKAIEHKGYAIVDIMQPCVIFNKVNTYQWYKENLYHLPKTHDKTNKIEALTKALEYEDGKGVPMGIFYEVQKPTFIDQIPKLRDGDALVDIDVNPMSAQKFINEFM